MKLQSQKIPTKVPSLDKRPEKQPDRKKKPFVMLNAQVQFENYFVQNVGRMYTINNINHQPFP